MNAARVRIGRVKMKAGGADVRVFHREPQRPYIMKHLAAWFSGVAEAERAPDAYAAVAFWFDRATPGRPGFKATQCTAHDAMPAALLARVAGEYIAMSHTAFVGADQAVTAMGGDAYDWTPDDAS